MCRKDSTESVGEDSLRTSSYEASADSLLENQSISGPNMNSVKFVEATHTTSFACDDDRSSISETGASDTAAGSKLIAIDGADHATAGNSEGSISSPQLVPGSPSIKTSDSEEAVDQRDEPG